MVRDWAMVRSVTISGPVTAAVAATPLRNARRPRSTGSTVLVVSIRPSAARIVTPGADCPLSPDRLQLPRRLEQLERIAVRVLDLDLPASRAHFHRIPEMQPVVLEGIDASGKIGHSK